MYQRNGAAQYRSVRNHGLIADASPTRLVQIIFENILTNLGTAQTHMGRIEQNRPLSDVIAKGKAIGRAVRLISQLDSTLDMQKGGQVAENLAKLYDYMLRRLTLANATNDVAIVAEVQRLVGEIKQGWDQIVLEAR